MINVDLHIHSELSSDASGTFSQIYEILAKKGIKTAALTNHIPEVSGHIWYSDCDSVKRLKTERDQLESKYGIRVLVGAEIDVIDNSGRLAAPNRLIDEFEFVVSGVHRFPGMSRHESSRPIPGKDSMQYGLAEYYAISEGLLRNPLVDVLAHPLYALDHLYPKEKKEQVLEAFPDIYIREIMRITAEEGKAVEINAVDAFRMNDKWFHFGNEYGTTYSVGSDAHAINKVGDINASIDVIDKHRIPHDRIIFYGGPSSPIPGPA